MNSHEIHLIRKTFAEVERPTHVAALIFYRRLFTMAPALRPMFKTGVEEQSRKLMEMLSFAVSRLDAPEVLLPELEALGARHGVRLLGIAATNLVAAGPADLFEAPTRQRQRALSEVLDRVRGRYGFEAIAPGHLVDRSGRRSAD